MGDAAPHLGVLQCDQHPPETADEEEDSHDDADDGTTDELGVHGAEEDHLDDDADDVPPEGERLVCKRYARGGGEAMEERYEWMGCAGW